MTDSEDSGPLSQQAKRRKSGSRSAVISELKTAATKTKILIAQPATFNVDNKVELTALIAGLKANLLAKKREAEHEASVTELGIQNLRSELSDKEHGYRELQERWNRIREEIEQTKANLSSMEREHEVSKAAISAKEEMLAQATIDIQELEHLAEDLPARLQRTSFGSSDDSISAMLGSFCRDIHQKYFRAEGRQSQDVTSPSRPACLRLDQTTKKRLGNVLQSLQTHEFFPLFAHPVTEDDAPQYFDIIKEPMDLSTMRTKLDSDLYSSVSDFVADASLMFDNCRTYNENDYFYTRAANSLQKKMQMLMARRGVRR